MHIQFVFRPLEDLESALVELYQWYADVFTLDAEARALFVKMATEERNHVALVRYQKKLVTKNMAIFGDVDVDLDDIRTLTVEARTLLKVGRPSLQDALTEALRFERSASESHLRNAMKQANPDLAKLLNALCQGDKGHLGGLVAFAKKRGVPTT